MDPERRQFLQMLAAGTAAAALPLSIKRALAIPAHHRTGTLADVEHVVFFMKENRSFDHYFGTLRGVRGFGDPRAVRLPSGEPVWVQPGPNGPVLPFRPDVPELGMRFFAGARHDWTSTHAAWREGWYDSWVWYKDAIAMMHMTRSDIPFHYALADAFTVCDAYHCSMLGQTIPNRMYMWTGWVGNDGRGGGPVIENPKATPGYGWTTYPEKLTDAGVSWKIYQDLGRGLRADNYWGLDDNPYIGPYACNTLLFFKAYQDAPEGSELYRNARTGTQVIKGDTLFQEIENDVRNGTLPAVSWVVAPGAYSEHPYWPPNWGAWYTSKLLDALTSNPDVWSKTVLFLTYDENDGMFDHVVPPTPPMGSSLGQSTVSVENEIFAQTGFGGSEHNPRGPYGLGIRVPMFVISPWSKGGWVSSEVFDHTSMLRFLEQRFGVPADHLTPWRRAVCGDLTSTLDFANPTHGFTPTLPSTGAYVPPDRSKPDMKYWSYKSENYRPEPPVEQQMPVQESGQRPARQVPYELHVDAEVGASRVGLVFRNTGAAAAVFQVRSPRHAPRCYTIGQGSSLNDSWKGLDAYSLEVYGPNGFYRQFTGETDGHVDELTLWYDPARDVVELRATPTERVQLTIRDAYTRKISAFELAAGRPWQHIWPLASSQGWYDLEVCRTDKPSFRRRFAGHLEARQNSHSDPQIGQPQTKSDPS